MIRQIRPALVMIVLLTIVTGLNLSFRHDRLAQLLFPHQANGSLIRKDGKVIGSELIGQNFAMPIFSWPSVGCGQWLRCANSSGSNYGQTSKKLIERVKTDATKLRVENPGAPVPVDLVTTSASGLDPDITPAAPISGPRVAKRAPCCGNGAQAVDDSVQDRLLGVLGEPHVNVLKLNMAWTRCSRDAVS